MLRVSNLSNKKSDKLDLGQQSDPGFVCEKRHCDMTSTGAFQDIFVRLSTAQQDSIQPRGIDVELFQVRRGQALLNGAPSKDARNLDLFLVIREYATRTRHGLVVFNTTRHVTQL